MQSLPSEPRNAPADSKVAATAEWYRILFDRSLAGIYVTALDGEILACNQACDVDLPSDIPPLTGASATCVFRILQESLTSVVRHAKATAVRIAMRADSPVLGLEVTDDGIGISEAAALSPDSFGLACMRERAYSSTGIVKIAGRSARARPCGFACHSRRRKRVREWMHDQGTCR